RARRLHGRRSGGGGRPARADLRCARGSAHARVRLAHSPALGTIGMLPGMELLEGAVDNHVHACPHLNARSVTVFEAARQAAAAGMRALGLMDNFCNSAGYAALA